MIISLEFPSLPHRHLSTFMLLSILVSKLTSSLKQTFMTPKNSFRVLLIRPIHLDFCVEIILDCTTLQKAIFRVRLFPVPFTGYNNYIKLHYIAEGYISSDTVHCSLHLTFDLRSSSAKISRQVGQLLPGLSVDCQLSYLLQLTPLLFTSSFTVCIQSIFGRPGFLFSIWWYPSYRSFCYRFVVHPQDIPSPSHSPFSDDVFRLLLLGVLPNILI